MKSMPCALLLVASFAVADEPEWVFKASADDGLSVNRTDGRFGAQLDLLVQARFQAHVVNAALADDQFLVNIVRPQFRAHFLFPWIRLFVQPELAGTPRLLDLDLDVQPLPSIGIKFGQFITPFSRAFMTPVPKFLMPSLSVANTFFRGDRDTGAMLYGMPFEGRLEYFVGVFNGNGIDKGANDNKELAYFARLAGTAFGEANSTTNHIHYDDTPTVNGPVRRTLQLGINGYYNRISPTTQVVDPLTLVLVNRPGTPVRQWTGGVDAHFRVWYVVVQGELYARRALPDGATGVWSAGGSVNASVVVIPRWLELATRVGFMNVNLEQANQQLETYELQAATYPMGNHLKAVLSYTLGHGQSALLGYPQGYSHLAVLHAQMWF